MGTSWGIVRAKAPGQQRAWLFGGTVRRPVWLGQSERGEEREEGRAGRGRGRSCRALWAKGRTCGFYPPGRWDPGGLWAEKEGRGLTQLLTGTLWLLRGGQTVG